MTVFFYSGITSYPGVSTEEKTMSTVPFKELDTASFSGYSGDIIKPIWSSNEALILSSKLA